MKKAASAAAIASSERNAMSCGAMSVSKIIATIVETSTAALVQRSKVQSESATIACTVTGMPLDRRRLGVSLLLSLVPLAVLCAIVWRAYVDVPVADEWEIVPRLQRLHDGTFSWLDIWGQHNEHRPLFGIAVVMMLVQASHWNTAAEIAANLVAGTVIFAVFAWRVASAWPADRSLPPWLLPVGALLVFSPSQWENWLWGWQVTILINVLAVLAGLALMARLDGSWSRLAGALLCGVVATYSFAAGL